MSNISFNDAENFDNYIMDKVNIEEVSGKSSNINLMNLSERKFINGIIRKLKPNKILELGVSAGSGSIVILNAIQDMPNTTLYSIDYLNKWWFDKNKDIGYLVKEKFPNLTNKWKLYTGGIAAKFMEEVGNDIDLCVIDTRHRNPGEILDFLMIMPFLKENCTIIMHDIQIHLGNSYKNDVTCCSLFSVLKGKKFFPKSDIRKRGFPNIGAVILDKDIKMYINDIVLLLTMDWVYNITENDYNDMIKLLEKYYDEDIYQKFIDIYTDNKDILSHQQKNTNNIAIQNNTNNNLNITNLNNNINIVKSNLNIINKKIDNIVNAIAWWIPVKKWRDNFRNKILRSDQIRSDQIRSDQIRSDQIRSDQ
ncbi:class I SAM-dependent methyltransferase [Brachyspira pulli]|uniref:class I SAM-dependent methyltransferase n=1 Tax=Brachyspira pulli TaxID=310721 RepID=UPI00300682BD